MPRPGLQRVKLAHSVLADAFSVYIHWPFCESKCTYCNFNKYVNPLEPPHDRLVRAMERELEYYLCEPRFQLKEKRIHSVYFGGGTPSLALPSSMGRLLGVLDRHIGISNQTEVTMEANPTSVESSKLEDFKKAGINRLSLGIQSFVDEDLKRLGRDHSGADAIRTIAKAKKVFGPDRVTFDLIFARPGQQLQDWQKELELGLSLAGDHISIYQLTMERGTPLQKAASKHHIPPLPTSDICADMYEETLNMTQHHGFTRYEVSNYSRDESAISRHNFAYWQGLDYVGIGPGAHGRLMDTHHGRRLRTFGEFHPDKYMALCESEGEGIRQWTPISTHAMLEELFVFGMRTRMGVPRSRLASFTPAKLSLEEMLDPEALELFIKSGFVVLDRKPIGLEDRKRYVPKELWPSMVNGGLRPTVAGLARMDSILPRLLAIPDIHE